jgi:hypothetical protein
MPLQYRPSRIAEQFEGLVIRQLAQIEEPVGVIVHNVLLPHVRDRYRPNEHDIILLLPWAAYTIDAKNYHPGLYRIPGNGIVEWRKEPPQFASEDHPSDFQAVPELPNPFRVAYQKSGVLHSLLTEHLGDSFKFYRPSEKMSFCGLPRSGCPE